MSSRANFWKFVAALAVLGGIAVFTAFNLVSRHERKALFERAERITGGNPTAGLALIERHGCAICHIIPGVKGTHTATVAPDLTGLRNRDTLAGDLRNNPENLQRWIMTPHAVKPGTAMPQLGLTETEALDVVAYLYTLE